MESLLSPADRTRRIKEFALRDAGFSLVGIAKVEPLEEEMRNFSEWLRRGYHAGMGYMERNADKRADPRNILPSAKSMVVVAQNYYAPHAHPKAQEAQKAAWGKISRYAWGDDYHEVLPPKLRLIANEIMRLEPNAETKIYTDTGAILEKQWAVRAGIGWQGKHSNVISRSIGSWFFLGVILTSAEFLYDAPIRDYCGTCSACVEACPTQAIVEPYVVDARRCIPYWTIETKPNVPIPEDVAARLDDWLFGCDVCQDVCPWNRFQTPTDEPRFLPRFGETALPLAAVQEMTQEEFSARFRKSPLKRSKIEGLQRNASALLENGRKKRENE
jgi:epoxyqueuosine reductase